MIQRGPDGDRVRLTIDTWLKLIGLMLGIITAVVVPAGAWAINMQINVSLLNERATNMATNILELRSQVSRLQSYNARQENRHEANRDENL